MAELTKFAFELITNEAQFNATLVYVAERSVALAQTVLGRTLKLDTLCLFSHSPEEYAFLEAAVHARGPISRFAHEPTLYVDSDFMVGNWHIKILGVRRPDPSRPWRGYGDYPVADYAALLAATRHSTHVHEITSGRGQSLLELTHPDFDVLGYVVDQNEHS